MNKRIRKLKKQTKNKIKNMKKEFRKSYGKDFIFMELAFWTVLISRYAKLAQLNEDYELKDYLYSLKEKSLSKLIKYKQTEVFKYIPEEPDKTIINLCSYHYDDFRDQRYYGECSTVIEYYYNNQEDIDQCSSISQIFEDNENEVEIGENTILVEVDDFEIEDDDYLEEESCCSVHCEHNYYSLFFIKIGNFSFHVPYNNFLRYIPNLNEVQETEDHQENSGTIFRFGRCITKKEKDMFKLNFVLKNFLKCLRKI